MQERALGEAGWCLNLMGVCAVKCRIDLYLGAWATASAMVISDLFGPVNAFGIHRTVGASRDLVASGCKWTVSTYDLICAKGLTR